VPTSVKNADRNALRCGPLPSWIRFENSWSSMPTNPQPNRPGDGEPHQHGANAPAIHRDHGEAIGDRREQQQRRVDGDQRQLEDLGARGSRCVVAASTP
jgi:hypothetical protein